MYRVFAVISEYSFDYNGNDIKENEMDCLKLYAHKDNGCKNDKRPFLMNSTYLTRKFRHNPSYSI